MRAKFINEEAGPKDIARIESLRDKSKGDQQKEIQHAENMAQSITNAGKAQARGEAAERVFGDTIIADIFYNRATELSGGRPVKAEPSLGNNTSVEDLSDYKKPLSKRGFEAPNPKDNPYAKLGIGRFRSGAELDPNPVKRPPKYHGGWSGRGLAILPLGVVNLFTGKCKYFDIYDTWGGDDTVVEVWETDGGKLKLIFGSGTKSSYQIGDTGLFSHDQTQQRIFNGKLVDWTMLKDMRGLIPYYGKSISGYTYK